MSDSFFFAIDLSPQLITGDPYNKYLLAHDCGAVMVKRIPVTANITDLDEKLIWQISASKDKPDTYHITTPKGHSLHGMVTPFTVQEPYILLSLIRDTAKTNWNLNITRDGKHAEINLTDFPGFYLGMNKIVNDLSTTYLATIGSKHVNYYDPKVYNSTNKVVNLIPVGSITSIHRNMLSSNFQDMPTNTTPLPVKISNHQPENITTVQEVSPWIYIIVILIILVALIGILFSIYYCYKYPVWCLINNVINSLSKVNRGRK